MKNHRNNKKAFFHTWKVSVFILGILFLFVIGYQAKALFSETISTKPSDFAIDLYEQIEEIHDISPSALEKGVSIDFKENDALRLKHLEKYYIGMLSNVKSESITLTIQGKGDLLVTFNKTYLIDLNRDGDPDIEMKLNETNAQTRTAKIDLKTFELKRLVPSGEYFELFDVTIRLVSEKVYGAESLQAFIIFENFGEGPSEIDIHYSIINEENKEVYSGIDTKIVQTEDTVLKRFDFLELQKGKYIIRAEIFYGDNQTAEAEQDFEVAEVPISLLLGEPLVFISIIVTLSIIIFFIRKKVWKKKSLASKLKGQSFK